MSTSGEGWFADPQDARRLRWWDGTQWTEHTHGWVPPADLRPSLGPGWPRLSLALQVALALTVPASLFVIWAGGRILDVWHRLATNPSEVTLAEADLADRLTYLSLVEYVVLAVCGVLFVIWLFRAHRSDRMDPSHQRRSSGWAIGSWFTPVVQVWFPAQVVADLRRGARGEGRPPSNALLVCWWLAFLTFTFTSRAAGVFYEDAAAVPEDDVAGYADALGTAIRMEVVSEVGSIVAAVLAILVVRRFTGWVWSAPARDASAASSDPA